MHVHIIVNSQDVDELLRWGLRHQADLSHGARLTLQALAASRMVPVAEPISHIPVTFVSVSDAAFRVGKTPRAVRKQCSLGRVPGARKIGNLWMIPESSLPEPE